MSENKTYNFKVKEDEYGLRLDKFIAIKLENTTRNSIQILLDKGNITVNNEIKQKNYKVKANDDINIIIPEPKKLEIKPQNIELDIVYEDKDLLVINKKKGMVVHPAAGNYENTLVNALLYHCGDELSGINGVLRPGIVHRIDKNTSGLLIVAKNDISHNLLTEQIKKHSFKREYAAIAYGNIKQDSGTINAPIGRHNIDRKRMCVTSKSSKDAITKYVVINRFKNYTQLKLILETGRTHQIRVHLSYINHPIAGDDVYGPKKVLKELNGQCLHAKLIGFHHPTKKIYMEFDSPYPEYFKNFIYKIKKEQ